MSSGRRKKLNSRESSAQFHPQLLPVKTSVKIRKSFGDSPIKNNKRDEEFNIQEKQARRSYYITVELPRDPLGSLEAERKAKPDAKKSTLNK